MNAISTWAVVTAEWTKIRTVRSTLWTLLLTFALSVGLGYLVSLSFRDSLSRLPQDQQETFAPLFATFYSLTIGQLPLVVFGVLVVTTEYTSRTIRVSLAAVPRRGLFYGAKVLAVLSSALGVSAITVLVTFFAAQAALGPHGVSLGTAEVALTATGACLYLTAICLFAMGVAAMSRSATSSLGILLPLLFLGSQGLGNVPGLKPFAQYLPDQAGMVIMHLTGPPGDPRFSRDYGPWAGMGILSLWVAAALVGGYLVLRRRDA
ncbi:ABC-type transport system involved in multi-copper enzyme maturation permease subunit [Streptosporangium album]|uniref:ABC-type transport system involved in multi-copper enzyme maturation permease subunit n=1 Tax=Streptosporangium album TaxID=47479 RepID=A0A7W7S298_9ACTN|nr:ABC transporter permease subunit [Streptosporangium album]MBB4942470.1 ABC-type transport system involved in multi-copper enzyme maturation permease subunit [Streptosporangium album]